MSGSLKRFVALAKKKNPRIIFAHYFLSREALISKSVVPQVKKVLDETIKIWPSQSKLFSALRSAMEATDGQLLQHMKCGGYLGDGCLQGSMN
jgi:hypothetical protein